MNWQEYIVTDKEILLGKPTIKGTRISVDHVVGLLAQGWTEQQIMESIWVAVEMRAGGAYAHSMLALNVMGNAHEDSHHTSQ